MYSQTPKLTITADGGGSNGHRLRLWKWELQKLANQIGLDISVCHFPPGTSKWNKVEHRFFSFISSNWRGEPLRDYETIVSLIARTTNGKATESHLSPRPSSICNRIKLSARDLEEINISRADFHGEWNYTNHPSKKC